MALCLATLATLAGMGMVLCICRLWRDDCLCICASVHLCVNHACYAAPPDLVCLHPLHIPMPPPPPAYAASKRAATGGPGSHVSGATHQIFAALDCNGDGNVSSTFFQQLLARNGLHRGDKRLLKFFEVLDGFGEDVMLDVHQFDLAISSCNTLIHKAVAGTLRIPNFEQVVEIVKQVFATVEPNKGGANADYIPQLAEVWRRLCWARRGVAIGRACFAEHHLLPFCSPAPLLPCSCPGEQCVTDCV